MWFLLVLSAVYAGPVPQPTRVPSHYDAWAAIGYREKVAELCRTHINNHRARAIGRDWDSDKKRYNEHLYDTFTFTDVCSRWGWVHTRLGEMPSGLTFWEFHHLDPWGYYLNSHMHGPKPFHFVRWNYTWDGADRTWHRITFGAFIATRQIYQPWADPQEKLLSHEDATFDGRPALRLVTQHQKRARTVHIDKATYQLLAVESDEEKGKEVTRLTYRDVGGKRYPTRYFTTFIDPDGTSRLVFDLEITEYAPHVPTAAEVDTDKRFGVPLPDFAPPTPQPYDPNDAQIRVPPDFKPPSNPNGNDRKSWVSTRSVLGILAAVAVVAVLSYPAWRRRGRR